MYRDIKKKLLILDQRKPYDMEATDYISKMNKLDWVYGSLKLDGSQLSREEVSKILNGDFLPEATVEEHLIITNTGEAIKLASDMVDMQLDLSIEYIIKLYDCLSKPEKLIYRHSNPVVYSCDYVPIHFNSIEEQMNLLIFRLRQNDLGFNPIMKSAFIHNKIIEIYPFEDGVEHLSRALMNYQLIRSGFPPVMLNVNEQEYFDIVRSYLKTEDINLMYNVILKAVYNKLDVFLQVTSNE